MNANMDYGNPKTAYTEVQERHQDIKRTEQKIIELAQLFSDVSDTILSDSVVDR